MASSFEFMSYVLIFSLINALAPGSVKKINKGSQPMILVSDSEILFAFASIFSNAI